MALSQRKHPCKHGLMCWNRAGIGPMVLHGTDSGPVLGHYGNFTRTKHRSRGPIIRMYRSRVFETWRDLTIKPYIELAVHYNDVIIGAMAYLITSLTIVYSTVYSGADQRRVIKQQSSASLAFVWGIHRWTVNSPHKWPVTRKMFPFDDVIMITWSE